MLSRKGKCGIVLGALIFGFCLLNVVLNIIIHNYKIKFVDKLNQQSSQSISLGKTNLSLFPHPHLSIKNISIVDKNNATDSVLIDRGTIGIKWGSLLTGHMIPNVAQLNTVEVRKQDKRGKVTYYYLRHVSLYFDISKNYKLSPVTMKFYLYSDKPKLNSVVTLNGFLDIDMKKKIYMAHDLNFIIKSKYAGKISSILVKMDVIANLKQEVLEIKRIIGLSDNTSTVGSVYVSNLRKEPHVNGDLFLRTLDLFKLLRFYGIKVDGAACNVKTKLHFQWQRVLLNLKGTLRAEHYESEVARAKNILLTADYANEKSSHIQLRADTFEGGFIHGHIRISPYMEMKRYDIEAKVKQAKVICIKSKDDKAKFGLCGTLNGHFHGFTVATQAKDMLNNMQGNLAVNLKGGQLRSIKLVKALSKNVNTDKKELNFISLIANGSIKNGALDYQIVTKTEDARTAKVKLSVDLRHSKSPNTKIKPTTSVEQK